MSRPAGKAAPVSLLPRLGATRPDSGLRLDGRFVWCSSVIEAEGRWHMFSAVWPERRDAWGWNRRSVLQGYLESSVVVRAEACEPEGPYTWRETVLEPRGSGHWDVVCCHNPCIVRVGERFVLFFQTCGEPGEPRRIGYALASEVSGPWRRAEAPLPFPGDAVNPAVYVEPDGSLLLAFRRKPMRLAVARAPGLEGPWRIVNEDCMPHYGFEDPFLWHEQGQYHMVVEDAWEQVTGDMRNGVHLVSTDGDAWGFYEPEIRAYGGDIPWSNGASTLPARRERPSFLLRDGRPTHLVSAVLFENEERFASRSIVTPLL